MKFAINTKAFPRFRLITEYRRDRWITFSPDYKLILRDIPNPHANGKLPIVVKYCFPQIDFAFGLSEVEISKSLADTIETLYNLAIDDTKLQLFPPLFLHPGSVQGHTIRMRPNARWLALRDNVPMPQQVPTSSRGASSALDIRQMAIGSFQTLAGTSDTTVKQGEEASMGKTPQALKMQEARQSTRDEFDRFCMESFIAQVYSRFANLIVKKMPSEITFRLFEAEIAQLQQYYQDIQELATGKDERKITTKAGRVHISAGFWDNYIFDYEITPGSTYKMDQQTQADNLQYILDMAQNQTVQAALEKQGKTLDIGEIINRLLVNSGIQDPDKILIEVPEQQVETNPEENGNLTGQIPSGALEPQPAEMVPTMSMPASQEQPVPAVYQPGIPEGYQPSGYLSQQLEPQARDPQIVAMENYINNLSQGTR